MKTWFGTYSISSHAEPVEATVLAYEKNITIGFRFADGNNKTVSWDIHDIDAVFDHSLQATKISNVKEPGSKLLIDDRNAKDYIEQLQAEYHKPWHKKEKTQEWGRNLLIFFGISSVLVAAYFLIVPWLSEKFASTVSVKTEEQFGNAVYDALSLSAQEDKAASVVLNDFFKEMKVATAYNVHITVVSSDIVNAFALPGGNIVVYTGLLKELKTYPELVALLSHEFTQLGGRTKDTQILNPL